MPPHIGFFIRSRDNALVREELSHILHRRVFYWTGRFILRVQAPTPASYIANDANGESDGYKSAAARNIDLLRKECGWSFDVLSEKSGLDKKLILGHVNEGKPAQVRTLKTYADTFTRGLSRPVSVAELESSLPNTTETPPA
jgi:hypothetical protein